MLGLVALLLEVQIVAQLMVASFVDGRYDDAHVEFSPSLFRYFERRLFDHFQGSSRQSIA